MLIDRFQGQLQLLHGIFRRCGRAGDLFLTIRNQYTNRTDNTVHLCARVFDSIDELIQIHCNVVKVYEKRLYTPLVLGA